MADSLLKEGLDELNLSYSEKQLGQLITYLGEIMLFNPSYRLVSNTDRDEIIVRHILDSASGVPYFLREEKKTDIIDLGSGAGFPGLVLAILIEDSHFVLCERMTRRVNFLRSAIARLALSNVTVLERSAEDIKAQFDIVTSRAFHSIEDSVPLIRPLLKEEGKALLYKGVRKSTEDEIEELNKKGFAISYKLEKITVPFLSEERNMLIMR